MATGEGTGTPASSTEPITRTEAKKQLEIDPGITAHDTYVDSLITMARKDAESFLHRKLIQQTLTGYLESWPVGNSIVMPFGNLQSITSVKYKDTAGDQTTWDSGEYIAATETEPGRIVLGYGETWPTTTLYPSNPIEIIFVAGYGTSGSDVPEPIRHAIKLILADKFENREDVIIGTITANLKAAIGLMTKLIYHPVSEVNVL